MTIEVITILLPAGSWSVEALIGVNIIVGDFWKVKEDNKQRSGIHPM